MAHPQTDIYTGTSTTDGSGNVTSLEVIGGRYVDAQPVATTGVVNTLTSSWSGTGFQLLSTIPDGLFLVNTPGHSGSAWDESRQRLWVFGSETHGSAQTDNSVYYFDLNTGLAGKMYTEDPRTGGYHIRTADNLLFANAAETRPWGMHTFRNLWYDSATKEIGVMCDNQDHSYADSWTPPAITTAQKYTAKFPAWFYNTVTGTWRYQYSSAIGAFAANEIGTGLVRYPGNGWWRVSGSNLSNLSEDGSTITNYSIYGKLANVLIQSIPHLVGTKLISIGGFTDTYTNFGYVCHLDNPTNGAHSMLALSSFPVLSGWDVRNTWSVKMPDNRILFGAYHSSPTTEVGAFIFDWNNGSPTVTDTGHRLSTTSINPAQLYDLRCGWSVKNNCAIIMSLRHGGHKVIGVRI